MAQDYGEGGSFTVGMEGPYGGGEGGASVKLTQITMPAAFWKGAQSPFSQVVQVGTISINSKINLQPSVEQLEMLRNMDLVLTTVNDAGTVTVFAVGDKPKEDIVMQATIVEVIA